VIARTTPVTPVTSVAPASAPPSLPERLLDGGLIGDPYFDGEPRFRDGTLVVDDRDYDAMCRAAEAVVRVHDEAVRLVADDESLLDTFFELTPCQKLLWHESAASWHGYARADIFDTPSGFVACELNSDTPTGHAETLALAAVAREEHAGELASGALHDPNAGLATATLDMLEAYVQRRLGADAERTAGIIYPTDLTEDLPLVRLLEGWLGARGYRVASGAPQNLTTAPDGRAALFGEPCSLLVRHYKTDWWGERFPVWMGDAPFDAPLPLAGPLEVLARAELGGHSVVVNPFGAVLTQNKRMLAFLWEHLDRLSEEGQATVRAHIPETLRLESVHPALLSVERESWVLKSDYGCEGDEVVAGWELSQADWDRALGLAQAGRWVVQRRFHPRSQPAPPRAPRAVGVAGEAVNYGVYVVAGAAAGLYARVHVGATDRAAQSVAVLVRRAP